MDNLETASNASDNLSDSLSSNLSSFSGLTGYEEELYDLKHQLKGSASPRAPKAGNRDHNFEVFEERIRKLNAELQNALKLNEKYKNDLYSLERRTELGFHEKFEKLMRHNVQLETQVSVANDRIRALLNKQGLNNDKSRQLKTLEVEQLNFEANSRLDLLQNEVEHWKNEVERVEAANNRMKLDLEEAKIDIGTKSHSIAGLKGKIVDLHMEMQTLIQANVKANNALLVITNELASYKKSELWYKEQLHQCRLQKSEASEEATKLHSLLAAKENDLNVFSNTFNHLRNRFEEAQYTHHQEKQNLLKTIDKLEVKSSATTNEIACVTMETSQDFIRTKKLSETYESTIQSLARELAAIKDAVSDQQAAFEALNKQNSDLVGRSTTLQKTLNEREVSLINLENDKKELKAKLGILTERLKEDEKTLLEVVNEKSELEVALNRANHEKGEIEGAVSLIRENFTRFADKYKLIKEELCTKSQELHNERRILNDCTTKLQQSTRKVQELEEFNKELQVTASLLDAKEEEMAQIRRKFESELRAKVMFHTELVANLKEQLDGITITKDAELKQIRSRFGQELNSCSEAKQILESEVMSLQKLVANLKEELNTAARRNQAELKQVKDQFSYELSACAQAKQILEDEVMAQQATTAALRQDTDNLVTNLKLKEELISDLHSEASVLKAEVALHSQNLGLAQADRSKGLLAKENCELRDQLPKFVANNFNGYCKTTGKQNELESWFLSVLEWIFGKLHEIPGSGGSSKSVSELVLNCSNQEIRKRLLGLDELLHRTGDKQRMPKTANVINRMVQVEDKCCLFKERNEVDEKIIQRLKCDLSEYQKQHFSKTQIISNEQKLSEEIKHLRISCKAKELESKEKQKRHEVNNRTLLKKVKEHMRGRNSAEKRCNYLQQLYNDVFDELNSYKLHGTSRDGEIQSLQSTCENYKNIGTKMKQEVLRLEKELVMAEAKCAEYQLLKDSAAALEAKLELSEGQLQMHLGRLRTKDGLINDLQVEVQNCLLGNATLQKDQESLLKDIKDLRDSFTSAKEEMQQLQESLDKETNRVQETNDQLLVEQKEHLVCVMQLERAHQSAQRMQEKNEFLSADLEALTCKLEQHSNDVSQLQAQKTLLESSWQEKEVRVQNFVINLQSEIQLLQNDIGTLQSDKYFLQRLCSDLKLALQTCLNQSKVLKKHIEALSAGSRECMSLPDPVINLPSPSKYDDAYINQLLKQSSVPPMDKPLGDLENCLNSLKKEMMCLKKQVTEKTGHRA